MCPVDSEGAPQPSPEPETEPSYTFPPEVRQVLNSKTKLVHLTSGTNSACQAWKCGSAEAPVPHAEFASSATRWSPSVNPFSFCRNCYGPRVLKALNVKVQLKDTTLDFEDSCSDSSESDSSSSSSS